MSIISFRISGNLIFSIFHLVVVAISILFYITVQRCMSWFSCSNIFWLAMVNLNIMWWVCSWYCFWCFFVKLILYTPIRLLSICFWFDFDCVFFGCVFDGLPWLPLGSWFDSGLSWLPLDGSPLGNGGNDGNAPVFSFGEVPVLAVLGFALLSGVCSFLWSALCSGREGPVLVFVGFVYIIWCLLISMSRIMIWGLFCSHPFV